jgi:hypothetical protein
MITLAISLDEALRPLPPPRISAATSKSDRFPRDSLTRSCKDRTSKPERYTVHLRSAFALGPGDCASQEEHPVEEGEERRAAECRAPCAIAFLICRSHSRVES